MMATLRMRQVLVMIATLRHDNNDDNDNNTSQYGFRFHGVLRDPNVGNLISTGSPVCREVDSKRSTKHNFLKIF